MNFVVINWSNIYIFHKTEIFVILTSFYQHKYTYCWNIMPFNAFTGQKKP